MASALCVRRTRVSTTLPRTVGPCVRYVSRSRPRRISASGRKIARSENCERTRWSRSTIAAPSFWFVVRPVKHLSDEADELADHQVFELLSPETRTRVLTELADQGIELLDESEAS